MKRSLFEIQVIIFIASMSLVQASALEKTGQIVSYTWDEYQFKKNYDTDKQLKKYVPSSMVKNDEKEESKGIMQGFLALGKLLSCSCCNKRN